MKRKNRRANQSDFSKPERDKALSLLDEILQAPGEATTGIPHVKKLKTKHGVYEAKTAPLDMGSSASKAKGRQKKHGQQQKADILLAPEKSTVKISQGKKRKKKRDVSEPKTVLPEAARSASRPVLAHNVAAVVGEEESDIEMKPEEEQSRALSVLDEVLKKNDDHNDFSDEDLHEDLHGEKRSKQKSRKVFIGNLPWKVDADTVQEDMEKFGEIDSFNMPLSKQTGKPMGVAFIVYSSSESIERVLTLNGSTYNGRTIRVSIADSDAVGKQAKPEGKVISDSVNLKDNSRRESDLGKHLETKGKGKGKNEDQGKTKGKGKGKGKPW